MFIFQSRTIRLFRKAMAYAFAGACLLPVLVFPPDCGAAPPATIAASPISAKPPALSAAKPENAAARKPEAPATFPVSNVFLAPAEAENLPVADAWRPLMDRLANDGVPQAYLRAMFGRLGDSYSHVPMGTKINELFVRKYMPKPPVKPDPDKKRDTPPVYRWALKPESLAKCREYMERHKDAFAAMKKEYGVPKEVVAGLLMVETQLGAYLGKSSSFWSLACLAASDTPERVNPVLVALPLPMTPDKTEWVAKLLRERSAWAYKELLALITHCEKNSADPLVMPGSVYGAIGICQFMPSNVPAYAVDGNGDGKIDLFEPADAIFSVGNYLKKHGWEGESRDVHHSVTKKYNKSTVYANTILALADALGERAGKTVSGAKAVGGKKPSRQNAPDGKTSSGKHAPKAKAAPIGASAATAH